MKKYTPVLILGAVALAALIGLVVLGFAPNQETQFIQNTLGSVALASVAAIAGLVRSAPAEPEAQVHGESVKIEKVVDNEAEGRNELERMGEAIRKGRGMVD